MILELAALGAGDLGFAVWGIDDLNGQGLVDAQPVQTVQRTVDPDDRAAFSPLTLPIALDASAVRIMDVAFDMSLFGGGTPQMLAATDLDVRAGATSPGDVYVALTSDDEVSVAALDALGPDYIPWDVVYAPGNAVPYFEDVDPAAALLLQIFETPR
jgi:hypothetical protein